MKKLTKSLLFTTLGLAAIVPVVAFSTTSCSSTPSSFAPSYQIYLGDNSFTYNNGAITANGEGIDVGGTKYTSAPSLDDKNINTYKANASFSIVSNVAGFLYNFSNSLSQLISRSPTTKTNQNLINVGQAVIDSGLDFALGSYLGNGKGTYRLAITSISIGNDFLSNFQNIIQLPNNENTVEPQAQTISLSSISINFGWWRSNGGSSTSIIDESTFNSIDKSAFENSNYKPQLNYSLALNDISFSVKPSYDNKDGKFPLTGSYTLEGGDNPYSFSGVDMAQFNSKMDYLLKVGQGDLKDINFQQAVNGNDGKYINENITKIIKQ